MNPAFLPPQQSNFNPPSNGFPPRTNNGTVPPTLANKNGPIMGAPSPDLAGNPSSVNGPAVTRHSGNTFGLSAYPPNMPQKNNQPISGNGPSNQPYLGNVELPPQPAQHQFRQSLVGQPGLAGANSYPSGPPQLSSGPPQLSSGPPQLTSRPPQQSSGPPQLTSGPPQLASGPPQLSSGLPQLSSGAPQPSSGPPQLSSGPPQLSSGPPQLSSGPPQLSSGPPQLSSGPPQLSSGPPHLPTGSPQLSSGPPRLSSGPPQLRIGSPQLPIGPPQLPGQNPSALSNQYPPNVNRASTLSSQNAGMPPVQGNLPPGQFSHQAPSAFSNSVPPVQGGMPPRATQGQGPTASMAPPLSNNMFQLPLSSQMPFPSSQGNFAPQQPHMPLPSQQGNFAPQQPHMPLQNQQGNFATPQAHMPPPLQGQFPPQSHFAQGQMAPGRMPGQMDQLNLSNQMQTMSLSGPKPGGHMQPPGYMQQPRGMQQGPGYSQMGPDAYGAAAKKLDPDQMPSPIQVIQDDQCNRSGIFVTNQKGLVPPLVSTNFVVQDQGNCSPRFIRSTMYSVPISQDTLKHAALPFSLVISPMARVCKGEYPPPIVDFGELGPVRCIRCKAYMCPYMQFIDSGRRFQCLFCKATTDVPTQYFQHLDHTGQRMDKYERPELVLGTYEFVATADYCRNNTLPKPPAIIFVIDVSYNNIKSGLVALLCSRMKEIIKNLPLDQGQEKSNMKVGFITYNSSVHFYNIKGSLAGPQMMIVGDTQEMFMPLLDGFLCTPEESETVIDALMEQIPTMFAETKETEIVLLPAILAGLEALKASETTGKLLVFHSTLPSADTPGKLRNRDDRKLLGTEKEKTVLTPQTQAYNQLGQDCVSAGCSVDLFIFNNSYIDIATISQVSRLTGGEVFKYTYFQADIDGDRLINDIILDISRPIAFDGIMRVRTSTGVRPTDFYGYFYMSNTTDMELGALDCDKGLAIEIKHDDKLSEEEGVYIQAALLYTSCSGQRRLRIMNLSLKTCSQMADLYRSCDLDTLINFLSKQATYKLLDNNPKAVKDALVTRGAQILATYRKNCASPSSAGQLILPECMKLLPLYINCLLRCDALSGGSDMTIDDRAFAMQAVLTMDVQTSVSHLYPRLIPLHEINLSTNPVATPLPIRCTTEKMNDQGVYLLENGIYMFLWVGLGASPDFVQNVFGAPSAIQIDIERPHLPELDNPLSIEVRRIIDSFRIEKHRYMRLTIVRQREKLEPVFKHFLVEDRGTDGSPSYVDFLCHLHKEIRVLLS